MPGSQFPSSSGADSQTQAPSPLSLCDLGESSSVLGTPLHYTKPPLCPPTDYWAAPTPAYSQPVSLRMSSTSGMSATWELREPIADPPAEASSQGNQASSPPVQEARPPKWPRGRRSRAWRAARTQAFLACHLRPWRTENNARGSRSEGKTENNRSFQPGD